MCMGVHTWALLSLGKYPNLRFIPSFCLSTAGHLISERKHSIFRLLRAWEGFKPPPLGAQLGEQCLGKAGWQLRAPGLCCMETRVAIPAWQVESWEPAGWAGHSGCLHSSPPWQLRCLFSHSRGFPEGRRLPGLASPRWRQLLPPTICILPLGGKNFPRDEPNTLLAPEAALGDQTTLLHLGMEEREEAHRLLHVGHWAPQNAGVSLPCAGHVLAWPPWEHRGCRGPRCGTPMAKCSSRPCSTPSLVLVLEGGTLHLAQEDWLALDLRIELGSL